MCYRRLLGDAKVEGNNQYVRRLDAGPPCYEGVRPGLEPGIPVRRPLSLVGVEPTSRRPPVVIQPPAHFSASQSLYGSNSSAPAITTINGRSVCSTSTVAPCASSTSGRRR